ncbi:MAG: hypothetical protein M9916_00285 [Crocinitomicaceae bacterium]|nr:hypothetical protein [Crocinitomicaceae bacterium]
MNRISLKIKQLKRRTILFIVVGITLFLIGVLLSFFLDDDTENSQYYVGIPLITGLALLFILKIILPIENKGELIIDTNGILIKRADVNLEIPYNNIKSIHLKINGYEMELKRNWWIFSSEFFPYEHGHNNEIIIVNKNLSRTKSNFFLINKTQENKLIEILKINSKEFNFDLKL